MPNYRVTFSHKKRDASVSGWKRKSEEVFALNVIDAEGIINTRYRALGQSVLVHRVMSAVPASAAEAWAIAGGSKR